MAWARDNRSKAVVPDPSGGSTVSSDVSFGAPGGAVTRPMIPRYSTPPVRQPNETGSARRDSSSAPRR